MIRIKVLIVDGDVIWRDVFSSALRHEQDIHVMGTAPNGKIGIEKVIQTSPDIIVFSDNVAGYSAADFTKKVRETFSDTGIILSSYGEHADAAEQVIAALEAGAFDFVIKPGDRSEKTRIEKLRRVLLPKIRTCSIKQFSAFTKALIPPTLNKKAELPNTTAEDEKISKKVTNLTGKFQKNGYEAVLVGVSTGGPEILSQMLPLFPANFPIPLIVAIHMPAEFTKSLSDSLCKVSKFPVKEADHGELAKANTVYIAPGGCHIELERGPRRKIILNRVQGPAENGCRPSINKLFASASFLKNQVVAVVLTGMGNDGTQGLMALKKNEVPVIVQDESSSVVWGMPGSVVKAGMANEILPHTKIPGRLMEMVGGK